MKIAVSGCLLGEEIRFSGGHSHDRFVTQSLGAYAQFVSFCPEHLAFGTPRSTIRLVEDENEGYYVQRSETKPLLSRAIWYSKRKSTLEPQYRRFS